MVLIRLMNDIIISSAGSCSLKMFSSFRFIFIGKKPVLFVENIILAWHPVSNPSQMRKSAKNIEEGE